MHSFQVSLLISAPPTAVWRRLSDVRAWPTWLPTVTAVQPLGCPALGIGAKFHLRQPKLRPAVWEVTELEEGRRFVWTTSVPGSAIRADHIVDAAGAHETELTLAIRISGVFGPLLGLLAAATVKDYLAIEASSLKLCAESDWAAANPVETEHRSARR
jgi:uncharacterized membrane protein